MYYTLLIYFHQLFVPSEIWRHFYICTLFFPHLQIWPFWPQEPKNSNFTNSFLIHYPQPKMNQKSPKDPKSILILTIKLLYTYFWKMLPEGALILLAPIWLTWAQISQPTSNHLKDFLVVVKYVWFLCENSDLELNNEGGLNYQHFLAVVGNSAFSFRGVLFGWFEEVLLKVAKSDIKQSNQITYRQCLPKVYMQQFHRQDKIQIWIFWMFLNLCGSWIMGESGIYQVCIFRFLRVTSFNFLGN